MLFLKKYAIEIALLIAFAALCVMVGYGHGYKSGWAAQQVTIDKMAKDENAKRDSDNGRLNAAEQQAPKVAAQVATTVQTKVEYRDRIVREYYEKTPSAETCKWAVPTINLINQVIDGPSPASDAATEK